MKIGIDARLWNESGVGRYIRNLVYQLQIIDSNNDYALFVLKKDYENVKSQITNNKFQIKIADITWHSIGEQLKLPALLQKEKLDLMHFTYFSLPIFYNLPFVATIHDLILHHFPTGKASRLPYLLYKIKLFGYRIIIDQAAKKAKNILTVSEASKEDLIKELHIKKSKVFVTYEGLDESFKNNVKPARMHARPYFLHVGNVFPHKNMERLLKAWKIVIEKKFDTDLVIVGNEDYFYQTLKEKVKRDHMQNIVFYGKVSEQELHPLYNHALALVIPSLMEGFGLPALEAMASNCLVIASNIPSLLEVCRDAALYINPRDEKDIAVMLEKVVENPSIFDEKKLRGKLLAKEYSWSEMAKKTLDVYESSIGLRPGQ